MKYLRLTASAIFGSCKLISIDGDVGVGDVVCPFIANPLIVIPPKANRLLQGDLPFDELQSQGYDGVEKVALPHFALLRQARFRPIAAYLLSIW